MPARRCKAIAIGAALLLDAGCGGSSPSAPDDVRVGLTPIAASSEWRASSPAAERIDTARVEDLTLRIRRGQWGRISSLLVVRNGHLAVEEYFDGMSGKRVHTQQSVTKSVTALLAAIAVQSGRMRFDDRVLSLFPQYDPIANVDSRKSELRISDLLTMRSGFDWDESIYAGSPLERLNTCFCDWLRLVLDWRMRDAPGSRFEYISGGTILLGGAIGAATGSRLDLYASSELFAPLGISGETWARGLPDGLPHAGGGLAIRPRDMAKLGLLMLDEGRWQGRQLIDPALLRLLTTRVSRNVRNWSGHSADYGYGWWLFDYQGNDVIAASGARGQWIFIVPSFQLVLTATGNNDNAAWAGPLEFLYSYVLPAAAR